MEAEQELKSLNDKKMGNTNHANREADKEKPEKKSLDVREFELINEQHEMEKVIRRPSMLPKSPTITSEEFDEYSDMFKDMPLTEETTCGIACFRSAFLQKFANKKVYVFLYGLLGCFNAATYAYFNGTITSLEKRFRISSRTTGNCILPVTSSASELLICAFASFLTSVWTANANFFFS